MRALWQRYGQTGIGVPEDGIPALASELAGRDLARLLRALRRRHRGPAARASCSRGSASTLDLRAATGDDDRGGKPGKSTCATRRCRAAGSARRSRARPSPSSQHVFAGGPAERAGLAAGDIVVAIDGLRASAESLRDAARATPRPATPSTVHAFRRDELDRRASSSSRPRRSDTCWLALDRRDRRRRARAARRVAGIAA